MKFVLLPGGFCSVSGNRYLHRGSNGSVLPITITGNVPVVRQITSQATMPFLDFAIIYGILGIQEIH